MGERVLAMVSGDANATINNASLTNDASVLEETFDRSKGYLSFLAYMKQMENIPVGALKSVTVAFYIIGVIVNMFLVVYVMKYKRYRSPTFAAIFSLAIADTGTCFGAALFSTFAMYRLIGPPWMCVFCMFITCVPYATSVWHMVDFSVMRFYQLLFPLKARAHITRSLITKLAVFIWLFNVATISVNHTFYHAHTYHYKGEEKTICTWDENRYQVFIETMYLLVPNILIASFHLIKQSVVKKRAREVHSEQAPTASRTADQHRNSTYTRAVTIVIVVFCITSWPQLLHFYLHFVFRLPPASFHELLGVICITMEYGNSIFNPFIYVFCARSIRRDVINMIKGIC